MKQYNSIKSTYPDALLLFRVGDFYETFEKDAVTASNVLDIVLTKRSNGSASQVDLAGFPHHALDTYLPKLVRAGYRVAICDQLEDPKNVKGIVKRGVTDLVSPGVVLNDKVLESNKNNFLLSIHQNKEHWAWSLIDVSTAEFLLAEGTENDLIKDFVKFEPKEIVYQKGKRIPSLFQNKHCFELPDWLYNREDAYDRLLQFFGTKTLKGFGVEAYSNGLISASAVLYYLTEVHRKDLQYVDRIQLINNDSYLHMDDFTIRNLELINPLSPDGTSLLSILDKTKTAMGGRLMRRWILFPLVEKEALEKRLNQVSHFTSKEGRLDTIGKELESIGDIERSLSKLATGKINPKVLLHLSYGLQASLKIKNILKEDDEKDIYSFFLNKGQEEVNEIIKIISEALVDEPAIQIGKGKVIREGLDSMLDTYRNTDESASKLMNELLEEEKKETEISSLKLGHNNVFGYYFEVRHTHRSKVPESWHRKQTLVNAERYITDSLKKYEVEILSAKEKALEREEILYNELLKKLSPYFKTLAQTAKDLANLDCLCSLSFVALENNYTKPQISDEREIKIEDGRHPVIEKKLPTSESYVANSLSLEIDSQQILMITGPNMSGKSAVLRQVALITLMAQMGGFVPTKHATIGLVDKIFTRVGASDNISGGESTFMVEMNEAAGILNNISKRSLVILDEIGRGTATYDGISIAWAIAQYLHEHPWKPLTLFATHYHELNEMERDYPRIKNYTISIKKLKDKILFLRKLIPGGSAHSFGIHVAQIAGLPKIVVRNATKILKGFDTEGESKRIKEEQRNQKYEDMQLSFFQLDDPILEDVRDEIQNTDINTLTPVEALLKLQTIKDKLK